MWPIIVSIIKYLINVAVLGGLTLGYAAYKELKKTEKQLKEAEETIKHLEKKIQCAEKVIEMYAPDFFKGGVAEKYQPQSARNNTKGE